MIQTTEDINSKFLDYLRKKGIREGSRIPPERELAEILETSRPTLRKVLSFYEKRKILERRGRNGTVVKKLPESDYMSYSSGDANPRIVSVAIPDLTYMSYMGSFWKYSFVQDYIMSRGYVLNAYYSGLDRQSPEKEKKYLESLFSIRPRGLVILATCLRPTNDALFAELQDNGVKVVHVDYYRDKLPSESFMMPDYRLAGANAVSYLRSSGCKKINLLDTSYLSPACVVLRESINDATSFANIKFKDDRQVCSGEDFQKGILDEFCRNLDEDEGLIVRSYYGLKFFAELLEKLKRPHVREKKIIGIDHFDEEESEKPQRPFFAFSWKKNFADAVEYIISEDKNQVHRLYSPVLLQP